MEGFAQLRIAGNRSGNQLGKHNQISAKAYDIVFSRRGFPINVNQIGSGLKGIETDSYRQSQLGKGIGNKGKKEAAVFEQKQYSKVENQPGCEQNFTVVLFQTKADGVVEAN